MRLLNMCQLRRFICAVLLFLIVSNPVVAWAGVSVDIQRGFFSYDHTDLAIGGAYPVAIQRHYQSVKFNGQPTTYGLFGPGTHLGIYSLVATYNASANEVYLSLPTGEKSTFQAIGSGKYANKNRSDSMQGLLLANSDGYTLKMENGSSLVFGASSVEGFHLSALKDRYGYGTSLKWDVGSTYTLLRNVCDPFGRCIAFNYTCVPNSITTLVIYKAYLLIDGGVSSTVFYKYDSNGNLINFRSAIDGASVQALDSNGLITSRVASGSTTYSYTGNRMVSITNPIGSFLSVAYNSDNTGRVSSLRWPGSDISSPTDDVITRFQQHNNQTKIRDTRDLPGRERTIYFDPATQFVNATYHSADQSSVEVYFDQSTSFAQYVVDELGITQKNTFTSDANSNLGISFHHLASTQSISFNGAGAPPDYIFLPIGPTGNYAEQSGPKPPTTYLFTPTFGQISLITDSNSNQTTFSYDPSGNLSQLATQLPSIQSFPQYNAYGNLILRTDAKGRQTTYGYDSYQNLSSIKDATGITVKVNYDSLSRPIETYNTNVLNDRILVLYDALNRVIQRTSPGNRNTYYAYDDASNLSAILAPNGVVTYYTYNAQGQIASRREGSRPTEYFYYNDLGQMNRYVDRKGRQVLYDYDDKSRLNKVTYSDGSAVTYTHDRKNRITSVVDTANPNANISISYQLQDLNPQVRGPSRVTSGSDTLSYVYDSVGNLTDIQGGQGGSANLRYTYNKDNSLSEARLVHDTFDTGDLIARFSYNNASELISSSYSKILVEIGCDPGNPNCQRLQETEVSVGNNSFTYDPNTGDLSKFTYTYNDILLRQVSYSYDYSKKGYLSQRTETGPDTPSIASSQTYRYNEVGELTSTQSSAGSFTNTFDTAGNPTNTSDPSSSVSPQYEPASNRISQFGSRPVVTDSNGNITSDGLNTYTWDARDQLVTISGSVNATFQYDGLGRRVSKTVNGITTAYTYSGKQVVAERTRDNRLFPSPAALFPVKRYLVTPGLDSVLASRSERATFQYPYTFTAFTDEFFIKDPLNNSVIATVDPGDSPYSTSYTNGSTIKTAYGYSPFGQVTKSNANSDNNLTFTGREDDGTGLYYYRSRYYSPSLQRFISEDPALFSSGDTNLYRYAGNRPNVASDPLGLLTLSTGIGVIQGAGGLASLIGGIVGGIIGIFFFGLFGGGPSAPPPPPPYSFNLQSSLRANS